MNQVRQVVKRAEEPLTPKKKWWEFRDAVVLEQYLQESLISPAREKNEKTSLESYGRR